VLQSSVPIDNADRITWQDEEVAWGDYVPYTIMEVAATSSIDRLVNLGIWPESERHIISLGDKDLNINDVLMHK